MIVTAVAIATDIDKATRVVTAIFLVLANAIAGGAANASASASARASASVNISGNDNAISTFYRWEYDASYWRGHPQSPCILSGPRFGIHVPPILCSKTTQSISVEETCGSSESKSLGAHANHHAKEGHTLFEMMEAVGFCSIGSNLSST